MTNRLQRGVRATLLGMGLNLGLAIVKIVSGVVGHSEALVADGVESTADIVSSLIVWRGMVVAAQPPDEKHPYGHGKAETLAAVFVAIMLLVAAAWITIHSAHLIVTPHPAPAPFTLVVLVAVIVIKEALFRFVRAEGDQLKSSALGADAWHHRSDALTSLAAGIGIVVSLVGGAGYESADDIAAVAASGVIAWNGWRLLTQSMDDLMDATPDERVIEQIREVARGVDGVSLVQKCVVRRMGGSLWVDMHVHVPATMNVVEAHRISHEVKDRVRGRFAEVLDVMVHIEPEWVGGVQKGPDGVEPSGPS